MRRSERDEWVTDLRSGEFPQGRGALNSHGLGYCCLGVKCERDARSNRHGIVAVLGGEDWDTAYGIETDIDADGHAVHSPSMPTEAILAAWGLSRDDANELATMNDGTNGGPASKPFPVIADWIEQNVPVEDD